MRTSRTVLVFGTVAAANYFSSYICLSNLILDFTITSTSIGFFFLAICTIKWANNLSVTLINLFVCVTGDFSTYIVRISRQPVIYDSLDYIPIVWVKGSPMLYTEDCMPPLRFDLINPLYVEYILEWYSCQSPIRFKHQFKSINFYSVPDSVLVVLRRRLLFIITCLLFLFVAIYTML